MLVAVIRKAPKRRVEEISPDDHLLSLDVRRY